MRAPARRTIFEPPCAGGGDRRGFLAARLPFADRIRYCSASVCRTTRAVESDDQSNIPTKPVIIPGSGEPSLGVSDAAAAMLGAGRSQGPGLAWQPPSPEELQRDFPLYEIRGILGRGGMGAVYRGWQKSLDRFVALKILPPGLDDGIAGFTERFKREAKAMAQLQHPGIVAVFDAGTTSGGLLYFVMECVTGTDVHRLLSERGRLDPAEALRITSAVCDALGYAHEHGIIHRDIKPSNIMLDAHGAVKVADFGLAKSTSAETTMLTMSNVTMGTPEFMAPEALKGAANVDHRADLYAVGVMLYQMLTGELPRGRFVPPSRAVPGLDKRLDAIVDRTLQPEPAARYSTAIELRTALEPVTRAIAKRTVAITRAAARKKPPALAAVVFAVFVVIAALVYFAPWKKVGASGGVVAAPKPAGAVAATSPSPAWEQNMFATMDRKDATQGKGKAEMQGAFLHLSGDEGWSLLLHSHRDVLIRTTLVWDAKLRNVKLIVRDSHSRAYYARLQPDAVGIGIQDGVDKTLKHFPVTPTWKEGDEVTFQFASVGSQLAVWVNAQLLGTVTDATITGTGEARLSAGEGRFKTLDILPLDGLPEAEALKLAGVSAPAAPQWLASDFATLTTHQIVDRRLHLSSYRAWMPDKTVRPQNVVMRASLIWKTDTRDPKLESRYLATGDGANLQPTTAWFARFSTNVISIGITDGKDSNMRSIPLNPPIQAGDKVTLKFASIGHRHLAWVNEKLAGDVMDERLIQNGPVRLSAGEALFDSFEYLPLDGLPEAEALKLAGISEVPKSPAPQVSATSKNFPPGQWVRAFATPEELPEWARKQWVDVVAKDGWWTCAPKSQPVLTFCPVPMKNSAVRARLRWPTDGKALGDLSLSLRRVGGFREGDLRAVEFATLDWSYRTVLRDTESTAPGQLRQPAIGPEFQVPPLKPGQEFTFELAVIGTRVAAKFDGLIVSAGTTSITGQGIATIMTQLSFRDVEVLNLDGLPEAEALKLAGISEAPKSPTPQVPASPTSSVSTFAGHRYQFVPSKASWSEAKAQAEALGGHLATITSAEEHAWFMQAIAPLSKHVWLGGRRQAEDGSWAWITGEPWKFTAWARHADGTMEPVKPAPGAPLENILEFGYYPPTFAAPGWNDEQDRARAHPDAGYLVEWDSAGK